MSPRAAPGIGLLAVLALLLIGSPAPAGAAGEPPSVAAAPSTFDNRYLLTAGERVSGTLGELGADDLLVYESLTVGPLEPAEAGSLVATGAYPEGTFTFVASDAFAGTATAPYVGETADGDRVSASIVFVVSRPTPVNRPPIAMTDSVTVTAGGTVRVRPLANDRDPDPDELITLTGVSPTIVGDVVADHLGTTVRIRVPRTAAPGTRRFRYTVADRSGATTTGTLVVTVRRPAAPPTTTSTTPRSTGGTRPSGGTPGTAPSPTGTPPRRPGTSSTTAGDRPATTTTTTASPPGSSTVTATTLGTEPSSASTDEAGVAIPGVGPMTTGNGGATDPEVASTGNRSSSNVPAGLVLVALGLGFVALAGRRRVSRSA